VGIFQGFGKALGSAKEFDVDELMTAAESEQVAVMQEKADRYVMPFSLQNESDVKAVEQELGKNNIVLLNISVYARNPAKLKTAVDELKHFVSSVNGDMARIDGDKILLTPQKVKIVKKRK
jgi:SepF-like predicted cell division protein (DUF552 family)